MSAVLLLYTPCQSQSRSFGFRYSTSKYSNTSSSENTGSGVPLNTFTPFCNGIQREYAIDWYLNREQHLMHESQMNTMKKTGVGVIEIR